MERRSGILLAVGTGSASLVVGLLLSRLDPMTEAEQDTAWKDAVAASAGSQDAPNLDSLDLDRPEALALASTREPVAVVPRRSAPTAFPLNRNVNTKPDPDPRDLPERSRDEVISKREALVRHINEKSRPLFAERFDANLAVHLSNACEYSGTAGDPVEIFGVRMVPGEGTFRTVLDRRDFPELYAMKDEVIRLEGLICAR